MDKIFINRIEKLVKKVYDEVHSKTILNFKIEVRFATPSYLVNDSDNQEQEDFRDRINRLCSF